MKKKKKTILICTITLVTLIFSILILNATPQKTSTNQKYYSYDDPVKVTIISDNKSFSVSHQNNLWEVSEFNKIPINQSFCGMLFNSAKSLEAENIFTPQNNLSDYGLKNPKVTVKTEFDKYSTTLKIGNMNPDKTAYYCLEESKSEIALVPISQIKPFLKEHFQYANLNLIPYSARKLDQDGNWVSGGITKCTIEKSNLKTPIEITTNDDGKLNIITPSNLTVTEDIRIQLENSPFTLTATDVYTINPSDATISSCGLTNPQSTITYIIDGETYCFKIGSISDSKQYSHSNHDNVHQEESENTVHKSYYVMINDIPAIYSISESNLPWLNMSFNN